MELYLPSEFKKIIDKNKRLSGALYTVISKFSDWITKNNMEFFPEYTDHGIDHIQSVLNTAAEIISGESLKLLSSEDVYVLASSVLLHDCAMHITRDGLWDLIESDVYNGVLLGFGSEEDWKSRWEGFSIDVRKFDESDLRKFFGEYRKVDLPNIGSNSLDDNQKIIVGDFVRKYHACLAQVISTHGIPAINGPYEMFNKEQKYLNELSGLVARSHNYKLRDVVDALGDERKRRYRNTLPAFLMGVLRIADYLQIKSDRTPKILFETNGFCSPISIREWKKHLSIISTHGDHPDEELLFVEAFPEDPITLMGIKTLLNGLQKELDEFWAVIGEVYSRFPPLNNLGITYRRVKSNIDNPVDYVEKNHKSYFPEVLSIKSDNQKLFPLLIKPLYGNSPQVGIRELLQNSVDACNERYSEEIGGNINKKKIPYRVELILDYVNSTVTVRDDGVGMGVDVIKNYFLKVGASYRTSEYWKSTFLREGESFVPRTGKFGIGMLAGFLIGHEIEVRTRKVGSVPSKQIFFRYRLDLEEIELRYLPGKFVGTEVTVYSNKEIMDVIKESFEVRDYPGYLYGDEDVMSSWWYVFDSPAVKVTFIDENGEKTEIDSDYKINKASVFEGWVSVHETNLDGFFWRRNKDNPNVYCNGIVVQRMRFPGIVVDQGFCSLVYDDFEICIFDNHGIFPLNLTRDSLLGVEFFELDKLSESFYNYLCERVEKYNLDYRFERNRITEFVEEFRAKKRWAEQELSPLVFDYEKIYPFASEEHQSASRYVLVDFIHQNQRRGIIYHSDFQDFMRGYSYSCFTQVEKTGNVVEAAVYNFVLNKRKREYVLYEGGYLYTPIYDESGHDVEGWVFVRSYDYDKIGSSALSYFEEMGLKTTYINDEWILVSKEESSHDIPDLGLKILELTGTFFIFVIYKPVKLKMNSFSDFWDSRRNRKLS